MRAQTALIEAQEEFLTDSTALLARLQGDLAEIEATNDLKRKREVIERYVRQITVESQRIGPRKLTADVRVSLRLKPESIAIEGDTPRCVANPKRRGWAYPWPSKRKTSGTVWSSLQAARIAGASRKESSPGTYGNVTGRQEMAVSMSSRLRIGQDDDHRARHGFTIERDVGVIDTRHDGDLWQRDRVLDETRPARVGLNRSGLGRRHIPWV